MIRRGPRPARARPSRHRRPSARLEVAHQPRARARRARRRPVDRCAARCAPATPLLMAGGAARARASGRSTSGADGGRLAGHARRRCAARPRSTSAWPAPSCASSRRSPRSPTATSRFDGDPRARERPLGAGDRRAARARRRHRRRRPRRAAAHRARHRRRCAAARSTSTPSSSSQFVSRAAARRRPLRRRRRASAHDGRPRALAAAHRDDRRRCCASAASRSTTPSATRWRVAPGPIAALRPSSSSPTCPTPRRSSPPPLVTGGRGHRPATGRRATTQAGDALRELLAAMGADVELDDDGLHRAPAPARLDGVDADLHDVGELTPVLAALAALADSPSTLRGIAHLRHHETDRLAALANELGRLGARGRRDRRRPGDPARARCTAASFAHLRRPPAGARRRGPRPGRPRRRGRERRHHGQDAARTSPSCWTRHCSARRVAREPPRDGTTSTRTTSASAPARQSRPRTKDRPGARGRRRAAWSSPSTAAGYTCCSRADGPATVTAMKARELGRKGVVVGDRVARRRRPQRRRRTPWPASSRVEPRTTVAAAHRRRQRPGRAGHRRQRRPARRSSSRSPTPSRAPRLIDRCLVAAYDGGLEPLLCLTKSDLADPDALLVDLRARSTCPHVVDPARRATLDELRDRLRGPHQRARRAQRRRQVDAGQRAGPGRRPRGRRRQRRHRPRPAHLDLGRALLDCPTAAAGSIDTPGIRSFGLAHVDRDRVIQAFPDLAARHRGLPARLHPRRARLRARRGRWRPADTPTPTRLDSLRRLLAGAQRAPATARGVSVAVHSRRCASRLAGSRVRPADQASAERASRGPDQHAAPRRVHRRRGPCRCTQCHAQHGHDRARPAVAVS